MGGCGFVTCSKYLLYRKWKQCQNSPPFYDKWSWTGKHNSELNNCIKSAFWHPEREREMGENEIKWMVTTFKIANVGTVHV